VQQNEEMGEIILAIQIKQAASVEA